MVILGGGGLFIKIHLTVHLEWQFYLMKVTPPYDWLKIN